ncbi:MAG: hypothetical protein PW786_13225 [Arachidicoccus sp.]|nr:hypothetical protein [Arachidicoccus sp.]
MDIVINMKQMRINILNQFLNTILEILTATEQGKLKSLANRKVSAYWEMLHYRTQQWMCFIQKCATT